MLVSSVIALLAIGSTSVSAYNYITYNLLKDDRGAGRLVFIPTTLEQKEVILSNVEKCFRYSITFQFKSRANPQNSYTVTVPYVSGCNQDCWELGSKLYKSLPSKILPGTPVTRLPVSASSLDIITVRHRTPPLQRTPRIPKEGCYRKRSSSEQKLRSMNPTT
ncbi:hypothetical protein BASA83_009492 [Batrachochytrium salamandrivorans]|nr:hypothetical protein BASA83_009492 [Batrachochytrium salamandrivorans]